MRRRAGWNRAATARVTPAIPGRRLSAEATEHLPKDQDRASVDARQEGGEQPIDQSPVDQPVDVIQAIAQNCDASSDRHQGDGQPKERGERGDIGKHKIHC